MTKITKENMQNAHDELLQTFVDKNADYGNSFESSLEEYGLIAALIRMDDKMGRLRTIIKSEAKVKDESISDTLRDLSNYALMASVWVDNKTITQEISETINRIKQLLAGDVTEPPVVEKSILDEDVELAKRDEPYYEATVSIDYILESQPTEDSEDKEFVPAGTRVRVYEKKGGWSRVNYKDSDQWIEDKYLTEVEVF